MPAARCGLTRRRIVEQFNNYHGPAPDCSSSSAATTLAVAGVILLVVAGSAAHVRPGGVVLAVGAGFCYAAYTVAAKCMLADGHAPETVMARIFGIGALLLLPVLIRGQPGDLASAGGVALGGVALGGVALVLAGLGALAAPRRLRSRPVLVPS